MKQKTSKYATYFLILFYSVGALGFAILYIKNTFDCSRITANNYSTSFSFGIKMFKKNYRPGIYGISGFVGFADKIVDTFHNHNQKELVANLREETLKAINDQFSTNPIL